jgi:hypothetical protein
MLLQSNRRLILERRRGRERLMRRGLLIGLALAGMTAAASAAPAKTEKKSETKPAKAAKPAAAAPEKLTGPMTFRPAEFDLAPGETFPVELVVPSPTGRLFQGDLTFTPEAGISVKPDARWTGRIPAWGVKTYPRITASRDAEGKVPVEVSLSEGGTATLTVNVVEPEVDVIPGYRTLTVRITNPFKTRLLPGRVVVSNPDRFLQDITTREFKVPPGGTQELVFPLPGYAAVDGETYDFTVKVESYHGYRRQKTHPLVFPPQPERVPVGVR